MQQRLRGIVKTYLAHNDAAAAEAELRSLKMPFAHHEMVKEGILRVMDHPDRQSMVLDLFERFSVSGAVSSTQFERGFWRVQQRLADCRLDVPNAEELYRKLVRGQK
ncbi:MAG: hypothetical protein MJA30_36745 [Cytophagales bacterium]|nr:hypothetical protein [Cytophagales bacterium]